MGPVKNVRAETRTIAHKSVEVEDTAVAILEFETGALGVIQGSTSSWSRSGHPAEIQITGTKGSVFMVDDRFRVWDFKDEVASDDEVRKKYGIREILMALVLQTHRKLISNGMRVIMKI